MNLPRTVLDLDPDLKGIFYILFHFYAVVSQLLFHESNSLDNIQISVICLEFEDVVFLDLRPTAHPTY